MDHLNVVREAIRNAATLDDLLIVLNETVPALLNADEREILSTEFCDLPIYGGNEPHNTTGVWSWDSGRKIVGDCLPFRIVVRGEEAAPAPATAQTVVVTRHAALVA